MPSNLPKFTIRTSKDNLEKLRYISDDHFRTINKEIEMLIERHIAEYEAENGEIHIQKPPEQE